MKSETASRGVATRIGITMGCLLIAGIALGGCQRDAESIKAALAARRATWDRELGSIKARKAAVDERLGRKAAAMKPGSPAVERIRAMLDGARQSLIDVEMQENQIGPNLVKLRSGEEAEKALEQESQRMSEYLVQLTAGIGAAGRALDEVDRPAPREERAD